MVITSTPLRISFFGGGTDYPVWFREHGGSVLSTAIDKSCYITCRHLPPFFSYHSRVSYSRIENVAANDEIQHPSVRACLQHLQMDEGVEIHHVADLPARTGLGTSSAFTVGLLLGLHALNNKMCNRQKLAAEAIHVEQNVIGESVGSQDQISAVYGGFNRIDFNTDGSFNVNRIPSNAARLESLESNLEMYFTGFSRTASEIAAAQIEATPNRKSELMAMGQMVSEAESILTEPTQSLDNFGRLLHESWLIKRGLTKHISNPEIDAIYNAGIEAGALGGKLLGAGGGGFMLFYVQPHRRAHLREALKKLLYVPFRFSNRGSHVVLYEPEETYDKTLSADRSIIYSGAARDNEAWSGTANDKQ